MPQRQLLPECQSRPLVLSLVDLAIESLLQAHREGQTVNFKNDTTSITTGSIDAPADWQDLDIRAVDLARVLAADAVEKCGSGHPGTAISMAPVAYLLFNKIMRHDPKDADWLGRDRFVLSCGHSSLTLYVQLYLAGYGLELDDLKALRTWGSKTPGHPEYGHTTGVEMTTGPLGQGLSSAVGMAMAARRERGLLDPDTADGESIFDHHIYVLASDGDIQEGITAEASSLAGHQELGNLIVLFDDNDISIEDHTGIAISEDTLARYESYGWHTQRVDWRNNGEYREDVSALQAAIEAAKAETGKPSIISLRSIIGWPTPKKADTGGIHGAKLGGEAMTGLKEAVGFDPEATFPEAPEVLAHTRAVNDRAAQQRATWDAQYQAWRTANPDQAALLDRMTKRELPADWTDALPHFEAGTQVATRSASGKFLSAVAGVLPELWGGSSDLAGSNNTTMAGEPSFVPEAKSTSTWTAHKYGRTIHFGIREHAMGAIMNGIALHGGTRAYGGTFMVFSDYMRPAVRLAALMKLPVTYVWTHDSIGLGEDGPTHQPIEHLVSLRAIPGLDVVRPADANETVVAWRKVMEITDRPVGLCLTRQNVPVLDRSTHASAELTTRGGYVLRDTEGTPDVIIIATGSEVHIALSAAEQLSTDGVQARVVSMPCVEWFDNQPQSYRDEVLPPTVKARVSVEAALALSWHKFLGDAGVAVSLEDFGASADYQRLYQEFGITPEAVVAAAHKSIAAVS